MDITLHFHTLTNPSTTPATQAANIGAVRPTPSHRKRHGSTALARTGQNIAGQHPNQDGHDSARLWSSEQASDQLLQAHATHARARPDGTPGRMLSGGRERSA